MELPRLGQILLAVGIPSAAVTYWQSHSAGLVTAGSAVAIGVGTLLVKASTKPMQRRLDQLGDAFDAVLSRQAPRYRRRYRAFVRASLRRLDAKGLATIGPYTLELGEVYVEVGLAPRAPGEIPTGVVAQDQVPQADRRCLSDFLDQDKPAVLAVLGGPGSGKTTALRNIAYRAASGRHGRRDIPVLLALRDHAAAIVEDPDLALPALLRTVMPDREVTEPAGWWAGKLRDGECLILFDGLDEVARAEDRTVVSGWVEEQISVYPRNDYVLTSRPLGYEKARVEGADILWVRPFRDEQVAEFLHNWYLATERRATGSTRPEVTDTAEQNANDLLERLAAAPALYELTVNPLLLTMIANVHRYRGALPGSRAELYAEICQVMLYRRQEAKKQQPSIEIPGPDKETLLARLAYTMMVRRVRDLSGDQLSALLRPHVARFPGSVTVEDFIADVTNNGLLVEREHELYAFAHHTFGEYLAARHIGPGRHAQVLTKNVDDAWWRETTLLNLALPGGDADPIVRACLKAGGHTALALAFTAATGRPLEPDLRKQLDDMHMLAFGPDADPVHRRLIAAVLVTENLSPWITTPAGTHVCPQPITSHLYTLFVNDTGHPAPDTALPAPPSPAQIVTGVWAADALALTAWINALALGRGDYRLPTRDEARCAVRKVHGPVLPRGVWTMEESERVPVLWNPEDQAPVHVVSGVGLHRAVLADVQSTDVLTRLQWTMIRAYAVALTRHMALARASASSAGEDAVTLTRSRPNKEVLENIRDLTRLLGRAEGLLIEDLVDLSRALSPEMDQVHATAPDLALDLAGVLRVAQTRGIDRRRDRDLDHALGLDLDLEFSPSACGQGIMTGPRVPATVQALLSALAVTTPVPDPDERRRTPRAGEDVTRVLLKAAAVPEKSEFVIDLGTLAATAREACALVAASENEWTRTVACRLADTAVPVLERRFVPTRVGWAQLRLPALVLAAEADAGDRPETGDSFRTLAAGITLLQDRVASPSRPEIILLARA